MKVYVYTRPSSGGKVREDYGVLTFGKYGKARFNSLRSSHWLVGLSNTEGVVKGHSVWLTLPDIELATFLLNEKDRDRAENYFIRSGKTLARAKR